MLPDKYVIVRNIYDNVHNKMRGATAKFKFRQYFIHSVWANPPNLKITNTSGYTVQHPDRQHPVSGLYTRLSQTYSTAQVPAPISKMYTQWRSRYLASFPGLPLSFVLWFVLSIIHRSGRAAKNALWFIAHKPVVGHRPPYVHLASTRRHSLDRCSQAFPIFRYSSTSVYYCERKPKNGGRPGNKAT